jgi:16S rRNA (cytosine967-C5)-methyltransferase
VPAHAAVAATVGALAGPAGRGRSFVNAVLRRIDRLGPPWPWPAGDTVGDIAVRTSHPEWIVELLVREFGPGDAVATLEAANQVPGVTLRPNRLRTDAETLAAELAGDGGTVEEGRLVPGSLVVWGARDLAVLPAVAQGRATPQDQASQAVAIAVAPQAGEAVLDAAAAPGGKATAMAELMDDTGRVVAGDLRPGRARRIAEAAHRLGLESVLTVVADGAALPFRPESFGRVLLDAPCSGLGVLRRRPEARWRLDPSEPARLAAVQRRLLASAAGAVRPGGLLVYSACTMTREETLEIDAWAADALPEWAAAPRPSASWRPHGRGALLLPHDFGTDGMYLLALRAPG